jgi:hypothetical protein
MLTAVIIVIAVLCGFVLLSALIVIPYMCALMAGQVMSWMMRIGDDASSDPKAALWSDRSLAEPDALQNRSRRTARMSDRHCPRRRRTRPAER